MTVKQRLSDLDRLARESGFESYQSMLYELYVVRGMGLYELSRRCHVYYRRTRKHLKRFNIPIRSRGGPNNLKVALTLELLEEIVKNGVAATAERLGVAHVALHQRLRALPEATLKALYERMLRK